VSELPGEIRESLRSALDGARVKLSHGGIYLDGDELEATLDRIARNISQGLYAIDEMAQAAADNAAIDSPDKIACSVDELAELLDDTDSDAPRQR
jgi:hypothetical protein